MGWEIARRQEDIEERVAVASLDLVISWHLIRFFYYLSVCLSVYFVFCLYSCLCLFNVTAQLAKVLNVQTVATGWDVDGALSNCI
jgi:hypothetical protein